MHEMSLAESMLQIIEEAAQEQGFQRVRTVVLEIGQLAAVEFDAMRFCFDAVTAGSIAEGATLKMITTPGAGWCPQCVASVPVTEQMGTCPQCGGFRVRVTGGTEMRVKELIVE